MSEEKTISPEVAFTIISTLREQIQIKERELEKVKNHYEELLKHSDYLVKRVVEAERTRDHLRNELGLLKESVGCHTGTHYISLFLNENAELKALLKECRTPLSVYNEMFGNKEDLLQHIDEVLR